MSSTKATSAFFAIRYSTHNREEMIRFIDQYRDRFTVEFICVTLNNEREGGFITSCGLSGCETYVTPSARTVRDKGGLVEHM